MFHVTLHVMLHNIYSYIHIPHTAYSIHILISPPPWNQRSVRSRYVGISCSVLFHEESSSYRITMPRSSLNIVENSKFTDVHRRSTMFHVPFFRLQMTQKVFEKEGSPGRPWHAMAITWLTCWPVALYCKRTLHNVTIPPSQSPPDPVSWCILWLQVHVDVTIPPPSLPRMRLFESDTSRFLALAKQDPGCWCSKVTLRPWLTSGFKDVKRETERERERESALYFQTNQEFSFSFSGNCGLLFCHSYSLVIASRTGTFGDLGAPGKLKIWTKPDP